MNILEIGPGPFPAKEYLNQFANASIVFVGENGPEFDIDKLFPKATYLKGSFLNLVAKGKLVVPSGGFDLMIASDVLHSPASEQLARKLPLFFSTVRDSIKYGGKLILEENYEGANLHIAELLAGQLPEYAFQATIHTEKVNFVHPTSYVKGSFSLHATKIR